MGIKDRFLAGTARQLGHPSGLRGRLIGRALNRTNRELVEAAVRVSGVGDGQVAADIGFGGGVGLRALLDVVGADGRVHGVDISTTMVERARKTHASDCRSGRLQVSLGSLLDLPLGDESIDAAITCNTVYFLDDPDPAFAELARVLRPGGRLVVGISDPDEMTQMPVTRHGFRLRTVRDLLDAMAAAGFRQTSSELLRSGPATRHLLVGEI